VSYVEAGARPGVSGALARRWLEAHWVRRPWSLFFCATPPRNGVRTITAIELARFEPAGPACWCQLERRLF
jgi:hypothetical protein